MLAATLGRIERLGQPEVEHLHRAVGAQLDVGGLQVAVDDAVLVRRLERLGNLPGDRQRLVEGHGAARDPRAQILALHQLHHQRPAARRVLDAVDLGDVRMVQRRERPRLALEPHQPVGVGGERVGQDLERHVASELGVAGAIDLPHAAGAERRHDLVGAEPDAGVQRRAGHSGRILCANTVPSRVRI